MKMLASKTKSIIKKHFPYLVSAYHSSRSLLRRKEPDELWPKLLRELNRTTPDVFFVEIGAMDGISFDPLYNHVVRNGWRGLLVEPLPDLFEQLKETYRDQKALLFENVAITDTPGNKKMYRISQEAVKKGIVPQWTKGISSFFNERNAIGGKYVSEEIFGEIRPHIVSQTVVCETLNNLFRKHNVTKIDIFQVDTEGYDYEVLKQLDFDQFKPRIIRMEWINLPDDEKKLSLELLKKYGYQTIIVDSDLLAWRNFGILALFGTLYWT